MGGSKIQPAFHIARFHLPCSGTVFLYAAFKPADVIHQVKDVLISVLLSHEAEGIVIMSQYCPVGHFPVKCGKYAFGGIVETAALQNPSVSGPHDVQDHILRRVFKLPGIASPRKALHGLYCVLYLMGQDRPHIISPGDVYHDSVVRMEVGPAIVGRRQVHKFQPGPFHFRIGLEQFIVLHIVIKIDPFTQRVLFLQAGCQLRQFLKTFPLRFRECFSLYLPVKKIFKLPMPGLSLQQA